MMKGFQAAMEKVAGKIRRGGEFDFVICAYLETTSPSIQQAIDVCVRRRARKIYVLPYFLLMGMHTQADIPRIVSLARKKHQGKAKIILCPYIGYHDKIVSVVRQRLREGQ